MPSLEVFQLHLYIVEWKTERLMFNTILEVFQLHLYIVAWKTERLMFNTILEVFQLHCSMENREIIYSIETERNRTSTCKGKINY
jgi:hypothetical protein